MCPPASSGTGTPRKRLGSFRNRGSFCVEAQGSFAERGHRGIRITDWMPGTPVILRDWRSAHTAARVPFWPPDRSDAARAQAMHTCNTIQRNAGPLNSIPSAGQGGHSHRTGMRGISALAARRARKRATPIGESSHRQSTTRCWPPQASHLILQGLHRHPASVWHFGSWERSGKSVSHPNKAATPDPLAAYELGPDITTTRAQGLQTTRAF